MDISVDVEKMQGNDTENSVAPLSSDSTYSPVIPAKNRSLFCFTLTPKTIYELIATLITATTSNPHNKKLALLMTIYAVLYGTIAFVLVPLSQNISFSTHINDSETGEGKPMKLSGMVIAMICKCKCRPIFRKDSPDRKVTRYVPFSTYNYYYILTNTGKELNPSLPPDLPVFGGLRAYFLFQQCTSYGILKAILFLNVILGVSGKIDTNASVSVVIAAVGFLLSLKATVLAILFTIFSFPYLFTTLVYPITCIACPRMTDMIVNPPKDTMVYRVLVRFWNECVML